jgi:hypothetical protein
MDIEDLLTPVYSIAYLKPDKVQEVQEEFRNILHPEHDADLAYIKHSLVPWEKEEDGGDKDIWYLYQELRAKEPGPEYQYYPHMWVIDRQSLADHTMLMVEPDNYRLLYSDEVMEEINEILREHGSVIPEWDEGLSELLAEDMMSRALTYARIPATSFRSADANLEIQNMGMSELAEMDDAELVIVPNPDWDAAAFVKKADEIYTRERLQRAD